MRRKNLKDIAYGEEKGKTNKNNLNDRSGSSGAANLLSERRCKVAKGIK